MCPHEQADHQNRVVPEPSHVAEHGAGQRGHDPEQCEGKGEADDESQRQDDAATEGPDIVSAAHVRHQQRDRGQDAGVGRGEDSPDEDG